MPATSPAIGTNARATLSNLGGRIRARRKGLRISATAAAEAAGISRVTLHRIERGEPSVTMGAYLNAITALGLNLETAEPEPGIIGHAPGKTTDKSSTSAIRIGDYPQLRRISWQLADTTELTPTEALNLYERNWRHVDQTELDARERDFIQHLVDTCGGGLLLV
ncbi:helix-turn-helix domain-containing protein [Nocardia goodfellowii]